jgi:hypothetical protein
MCLQKVIEFIRNALTFFSPSEKEAVEAQLLRGGEIDMKLTKYGQVWETLKCKDNSEYIKLMIKHGVFTAFFSSSPGVI